MSLERFTEGKRKYPMLPMRDIVVFPHMTTPFFIGRKQSIEALEDALASDRKIFVVAQKDPMIENPDEGDLYRIGTIGSVLQIMRLPNGTIKALFEGKERGVIVSTEMSGSSYSSVVEALPTENLEDPELLPLVNTVRTEFKTYLKKGSKNIEKPEAFSDPNQSAGKLSDLIAPLLSINLEKKQELLELTDAKNRLEYVYMQMLEEEETKKLEQKLRERVQGQIGKTQKEYYLNEQMKAIQKELGSGDDGKDEDSEYIDKILESGMPQEAREVTEKEVKKLQMMPPMSSEANIIRNYIDWLIQVPWKADSEDNYDLNHAQKILDEDHYGLDKVKERIIEFIAVASKVGKIKGPIMCLVGPPGVGKTSLARSVARAVDRKFVRMSLGGVRDEAEIRGHRRTYIGAMPGKLVQAMKKAKTNNPLMLLDEIDKMSQSHMGDPSAALLEVLDPEQNNTFMDHYLEVEYDLSNVLFFCTANSIQEIPHALRDRMEVITLSGYTEVEKENIAKKYLIPKQIKENGLDGHQVRVQKDAILSIIRHYTREAGVRDLERKIGKLCRKIVTDLVKNPDQITIVITKKKTQTYLGVPIYDYGRMEEHNEVGITTGLAWTSVGGELLTIEVSQMKGVGKIILTGKLGDVMKESAQAALSYVRSNANSYGIYSSVFKDMDLHIHIPEGATPKDGPSAGITLTTALISALTGIPVKKEIAMTGEVTLRGRILPIGGLKEKLLAAKRGLITSVIIPIKNKKDLKDVPDEILDGLTIKPMENVRSVVEYTLERIPTAVDDDDLLVDGNKGKAESVAVSGNFPDGKKHSMSTH